MTLFNHVRMSILSIPENVAFARVSAAAFASQLEYTINDLEEIKVAVSEAVANAIVHAYGNQADKLVTIEIKLYPNKMEIIVEDSGIGIKDIKRALQPSYTTDPERMGLGFVFMQSFMDSLKVDSSPGKGTKVIMTKSVNSKIMSEQ
ncbi:anti-sigma F factor [Desulfolucanica intricata]|uniref:anti-sigma F factor n=1 Tax=Desulfolucanica intricata TaxID=1285191 RepID=UPI00082F6BFB|nr:anti-sigma F factor [Desulfolucanica intricata]